MLRRCRLRISLLRRLAHQECGRSSMSTLHSLAVQISMEHAHQSVTNFPDFNGRGASAQETQLHCGLLLSCCRENVLGGHPAWLNTSPATRGTSGGLGRT